MPDFLKTKLDGQKILLLGFGREGQSSYRLIRKALPNASLAIADADDKIKENLLLQGDEHVDFNTGQDYLKGLDQFDLIIKTPGITLKDLDQSTIRNKITSQTDLFLQMYSKQVIGITGTKGKSTTSTLLWHTLKRAGKDTLLLGNIGRPALNCLEDIHPETIIIYEMSSHQLEYISVSPHIAILLNLFEEHLDAYRSFRDYQLAKMNITRYQIEDDFFIYHADDKLIPGLVSEFSFLRNYKPFSAETRLADGCFIKEGIIFYSDDFACDPVYDLNKKRKLKGDHNVRNIMAVITACKILGIDNETIEESIGAFTGLEHRMEYAGQIHGIHFYNDSIATIPEATIEAVKALETVDTIILGGFDRGIDYSGLAGFLAGSAVRNLIFTGDAGKRIMDLLQPLKKPNQNFFYISRFDDLIIPALSKTRPGHICLLSPAAASYDEFLNFEMRGKRFKELISGIRKNTASTNKTV